MTPTVTPSIPSTKPYLLRALWEWCCDHGFTPYLAVAVDEYCRVPQEFVRDGQIVLNISEEAAHGLQLQNDMVCFQARFNGVAQEVSVPVARVAALYSRENGVGMTFSVDLTESSTQERAPFRQTAKVYSLFPSGDSVGAEEEGHDEPPPAAPSPEGGGKTPFLRRVK
ncbi:MAG: ClpXP protease specificity-enhancing factor [Zoogloeaceae bacterium]|jgi:stringent starvation protein B|nr:ClpXP protease specificity-enhancing factor [Zoogloeaceae bacterium]